MTSVQILYTNGKMNLGIFLWSGLPIPNRRPSWYSPRSEIYCIERRSYKKKRGGGAHLRFHPLCKTCLSPQECAIFTFPPSHSSSPHALQAQTQTLPPPQPSSSSSSTPLLTFAKSSNVNSTSCWCFVRLDFRGLEARRRSTGWGTSTFTSWPAKGSTFSALNWQTGTDTKRSRCTIAFKLAARNRTTGNDHSPRPPFFFFFWLLCTISPAPLSKSDVCSGRILQWSASTNDPADVPVCKHFLT